MQRFSGKTVIVTGGGGGIGGATCRRFAQEGAHVAILDVNLDAATQTASAITATGATAVPFRCDITNRVEVDAAIDAADSGLGAIDILVNNAAWDAFKPFTDTSPEQRDKQIAINLIVAPHLHQPDLPRMVARNAERIITTASAAARAGTSAE